MAVPPGTAGQTLEGILWALRTGATWRDLPARFGKWNSVYRSFSRWRRRGVFRRLSLAQELNLRVLPVDGAFVKAHQCSVGAPKAGGRPTSPARRKPRVQVEVA